MTTAERLAEAEDALHRLRTGGLPVIVRDQNGESITYNVADGDKLAVYVAALRSQLSGKPAPQTIRFQTSKGL